MKIVNGNVILVCEICKEPIALFDPTKLTLPFDLSIFGSLYPDRHVPPPFPAALDDWTRAACPRCKRRPFLNNFDRGDGTYVVGTGETVPEGQQWFVMILGDSGNHEKMLISPQQPKETPAELPPQEPQIKIVEDRFITEADEPEPTGNYKSPPVTCPTCGKQFRSQGRMAKYHKDCPSKIQPPREGFKI